MLASYHQKLDSYIVVGVTNSIFYGDVLKKWVKMWFSTFGLAFQMAASNSGARNKHDGFESSVIEINQADFSLFIENLSKSHDLR